LAINPDYRSPAISLGGGTAVISPDGKWILSAGRKSKLLLQPVGAGEPKELPMPGLTIAGRTTWSEDGRFVAYEG
jgi:hypothetical protein